MTEELGPDPDESERCCRHAPALSPPGDQAVVDKFRSPT